MGKDHRQRDLTHREIAPSEQQLGALHPALDIIGVRRQARGGMGIYGASPEDVAAFQREGDSLTPMKRIATVDEVARAVLFLGFEATFTTGSELVLDGGITTLVAPTHS